MFFELCTFASRTSILSIILFFLPFGLCASDEFDEARASVGRGFPVWDNDKSFYWDMKDAFSACFGAAGRPCSAFVSICWNFRAAVFSGR